MLPLPLIGAGLCTVLANVAIGLWLADPCKDRPLPPPDPIAAVAQDVAPRATPPAKVPRQVSFGDAIPQVAEVVGAETVTPSSPPQTTPPLDSPPTRALAPRESEADSEALDSMRSADSEALDSMRSKDSEALDSMRSLQRTSSKRRSSVRGFFFPKKQALEPEQCVGAILAVSNPEASHEAYLTYLSRVEQNWSKARAGMRVLGAHMRSKNRLSSESATDDEESSDASTIDVRYGGFVGEWAEAQKSNYDKYLKEVVGLNWATRKIAMKIQLNPTFTMVDGELNCTTVCIGAKPVHEVLKLGSSVFNEPNQGVKVQTESYWERFDGCDKFVSDRNSPKGPPIKQMRWVDKSNMLVITQDWGGEAPFVAKYNLKG